jgi:putative oxidoreductase
MIAVPALYHRIAAFLSRLADAGLPLAARFVFAAVLFGYFWASGLTKIGDGVFSPSVGAYAQIFPRVFEAAGYDASQMSGWQTMVVLAGTLAEFVLPILIVTGLFTRLAALGMVGFVVVQSLTDIVGHKAGPETVGAWFDRASDAAIMDQRAFWVLCLLILIGKGAGALSVDRVLTGMFPLAARHG